MGQKRSHLEDRKHGQLYQEKLNSRNHYPNLNAESEIGCQRDVRADYVKSISKT